MTLHILRFIFIIIGIYSVVDASIPQNVRDYYNSIVFGRNQFLTILGVQATIITTILKLLSFTKMKIFDYAFDFLYPIALLVEFTITLGFWPLWLTAPDQIEHKVPGSDYKSPLYLEFTHHLLPLLLLLVEGFTSPVKDQNIFIFTNLIFSTLIIMPLYYVLAYLSHKYNNRWPYPMLDNISHIDRVYIFIGFALMGLIPTTIFLYISNYIKKRWLQKDEDKETESTKNKSTKKKSNTKTPTKEEKRQ